MSKPRVHTGSNSRWGSVGRLVLALCISTVAGAASADDAVPARRVGADWASGAPQIDVSVVDFLNRQVQLKLRSGLPQRVVLEAVAYPAQSKKKPLGAFVQSCRIVYDIWSEDYRITRETRGQSQQFTAQRLKTVADLCLRLKRAPVGDPADYARRQPEVVQIGVVVELNPLSKKTLRRVRRWLAQPSGKAGIGDDAFFGSFVSLLVNPKVGSADYVLRFESQPLRYRSHD